MISPLDILPEQASVVVVEAGTAAAPSDFEQPTYKATSLLASYLDPSENLNHVSIKKILGDISKIMKSSKIFLIFYSHVLSSNKKSAG